MTDVLNDAYNEGDMPPPERLARLQTSLTAMHDAMTDLSNRAAVIAVDTDAGVHAPAKANALLKEVTAQQRKLTAKVAMIERIIASLDDEISE